MFINGSPTYNKEGKKTPTGLVAGRAARDGELLSTRSGKSIGSVSVPAYDNADGTTVWLTIKGFGHWARLVASCRKGNSIVAFGRVESRDYESRTYHDLVADYVLVSSGETAAAAPPAASGGFGEIEDDGDLPF